MFGSVENPLLFIFLLTGKYEGNPLSFPEGEAAQGGYPPDPLLKSG